MSQFAAIWKKKFFNWNNLQSIIKSKQKWNRVNRSINKKNVIEIEKCIFHLWVKFLLMKFRNKQIVA